MDRLSRLGAVLALVAISAVVAVGCGGETTDVTGGVENLNKQLTDQGLAAKLDCPDEVDGGEGTDFECTLKADDGSAEEKVQMEVQKENDKLVVDVRDQAAWAQALQTVAGQEAPAPEEAPAEEEAAPEEEVAPEEETP